MNSLIASAALTASSFCNQTAEMTAFSGIRSGDTGSYSSCLNLWAPANGGDGLSSYYAGSSSSSSSSALGIARDGSAKYCVVMGDGDIRPPPLIGFCVPSACDRESMFSFIANNDTNSFIRNPFISSFAGGTVKAFCSDDEIDMDSRRLGIGMLVVLLLILLLVFVCTVYDYVYGLTDSIKRTKARMSTALMSTRAMQQQQQAAMLQQQQQIAAAAANGYGNPNYSAEVPITVGLGVVPDYRPPTLPSYYKHADNTTSGASPLVRKNTASSLNRKRMGSAKDTAANANANASAQLGTSTRSKDAVSVDDLLAASATTAAEEATDASAAVPMPGNDNDDSSASPVGYGDDAIVSTTTDNNNMHQIQQEEEGCVTGPSQERPTNVTINAPPAHYHQPVPAEKSSTSIKGLLGSITANLAKRATDSTRRSNGGMTPNRKRPAKERRVTMGDGLSQPLFYSDGSSEEDEDEDDDSYETLVEDDDDDDVNEELDPTSPTTGRVRASMLGVNGTGAPSAAIYRKSRDLTNTVKRGGGGGNALRKKNNSTLAAAASPSAGFGIARNRKKKRVGYADDVAGGNGRRGGAGYGSSSMNVFSSSPLSSRFTEYADAHFTHELEEGDLSRSEKVRTQIALHMERIIDDIPHFDTVFARMARTWSLIATFRRWRQHDGMAGNPYEEVSAAGGKKGAVVVGGPSSASDGGNKGSNLRIFNSIRTLCWVWIVMTDTFEYTTQIPTYEGAMLTHTNPAYAFLNRKACDTFAIGTFLMVSGFTVIHQLRQEEKRMGKDPVTIAKNMYASIPTRIRNAATWYISRLVRRWIRLVPLYLAIVFISQATLLAKDGGAFWSAFLQNNALHGNCVKNFFYTNIFFVNNLAPADIKQRCFPWTFYFALDFQCFAIAPIFHHIHRRTPKWLFYPILALLCGGTIYARFATQISCEDKSTDNSDVSDSVVPLHSDFTTPWTMLIPYLFGGILCYFHAATINKAMEIKMFGPQAMNLLRYSFKHTASSKDKAVYWLLERLNSKPFRVLCIWGGVAIALSTLFGSWGVARDYETSCTFRGRIFAAFSVVPWCFGIFFSMLPMLFGYGGGIQRLLTHRLWTNSSKLIFAAYLTHPVLISIVNCIKDHPQTFDALPFMYEVWGNATLSLLTAFAFHLVIEQPFMYIVSDEEM